MSVLEQKRSKQLDGNMMASQMFANVFRTYLECSDEVQAAIRDMVEIVNDPEATNDEENAAILTIAEALFPSNHKGSLGVDLEESEQSAPPDVKKIVQEMDEEQAAFGDRVNAVLREKNMTQSDLASQVGVGQPAISMMLLRKCRPQRTTVKKIADALEMQPSNLWPCFDEW